MNRYHQRSIQAELIDEAGISFSDWTVCLKELNTINSLLGGHDITVEGVRLLLPAERKEIIIAEIGCGGGDNLKAIHRWNVNKHYPLRYIGIDLNEACISFADKHCSELSAEFICSDYRQADLKNRYPDIIFSSLFCHHFTDIQLVDMLIWLKLNSRVGFFINDLQRHPLAFHSIQLLTRLFSGSYLVKNDAPISVLRGFKRAEWKILLQRSGIENYSIKWKWAFRFLIIVNNE